MRLAPTRRGQTALIAWMLVIFATSCSFIERQVFIDFVQRFIPTGVPRQLWVSAWSHFGIFVVKAYHVAEFALLCFLLHTTLRRSLIKNFRRAMMASVLISLAYAISDEWHQTFVPGRGGTWVDVIIDALGISLAAMWLWRRENKSTRLQVTQQR